ncbi:MAG: iron-sulfur cluster assembly accessory protein [Cyanobacteria bacterium P01_G01_bin.54]
MIHLSAAAAQEIRRLQTTTHREADCLQLSIAPGGCQDWAYRLAFVAAAQVAQTDLQLTDQDLKVAIAPEHLPHLENLTLDYAEDLMGGSFRFENPNVTQTCSCGHSFSHSTTTES